jgi:DNA mismatch endonuclease (patch repair protein)
MALNSFRRVDNVSRKKRSSVMSAVRSSKNHSTELRLISLLRLNHITGWRRKVQIQGRPDFVFPKEKVAIFVDGCFWHCCPRHGRIPKSRIEFWTTKLARNAERDQLVSKQLRLSGWTVLRIWECNLSSRYAQRTVRRILRALHH